MLSYDDGYYLYDHYICYFQDLPGRRRSFLFGHVCTAPEDFLKVLL